MTIITTSPFKSPALEAGRYVTFRDIQAVFLTGPADSAEQVLSAHLAADNLQQIQYNVTLTEHIAQHQAAHPCSTAARFQTDAEQITLSDAVAVLPGWEHSAFARVHVAIAESLDLPVLDATTGVKLVAGEGSVGASTIAAQLTAFVAGESSSPHAPAASNVSGVTETRVTSATGGAKGQKEARFDLIPPGPYKELAVLYGRGATKYDETNEDANWKRGYAWSLSYAALLRHLQLWWSREEDHDVEMGVKHMTNVAWHAFNLAWFMENRPEFDDRPQGSKNPDGSMTGEVYEGALPTPQWILDKLAAKASQA